MTPSVQTTLPLNRLHIDPMNVRRHRGAPEPEFVASIRHGGVNTRLEVRPNGDGWTVFAGGKRLETLQLLAKSGEIAPDAPAPVELFEDLTDAEARERSLTENFVRADMHPVDEYRAFLDMHQDKGRPLDAAAIASRFGLEVLHVEQRLALGALDDAILDAWLAGEIDQETAQAFTLCPSKKAQKTIYEQLRKQSHHVGAWAVRRALKIDNDNPGRYLGFVGQEAYEARGGKVTRDLFGENHVISDPKLMAAMVGERLAETMKRLTDAGWAWAIQRPNDSYSYGEIEGKAKLPAELKAKLDAANKVLEKLQRQDEHDYEEEKRLQAVLNDLEEQAAPLEFTPEQKAKSGCFVSIDHEGRLSIDYGKVKPSEKRAAAASERRTAPSGVPLPKPSEAKVISNALRDRLEDQLIAATKKALKADSAAAGLPTVLRDLVAGMIGGYGMPDAVRKALPAIRDAIRPKVMNDAVGAAFDRADYFGNAPIPVLLAAITEAVGADEARKLKGKKKADVAKFASANVGKTAWLPKELRTVHYAGPGAKAAKKAAAKIKRK